MDWVDTEEDVQGLQIIQIVLVHSAHIDQFFRTALIVDIEAEGYLTSFELGLGHD